MFGLKLIKISGHSMAPTLNDGEYAICTKIKPRSVRAGLVCLIHHIDLGMIVKRIGEPSQNGVAIRYNLIGDNAASIQSPLLAPAEPERIAHRVRLAIGKSGLRIVR